MSLPPRPPGDDPADRPDPPAPTPYAAPSPPPAPSSGPPAPGLPGDPFAPPTWTPKPDDGPPPPSAGPFPPGAGMPGPGGGGAAMTDDDRLWALVAHFGGAAATFFSGSFVGWIPPLVAYLVRGDRPAARAHAVAALNFQLFWTAVSAVIALVATCLLVVVIGFLLYFLLIIPWLMGTIFGIIAGVKALNGEPYRYPGAPRWVK